MENSNLNIYRKLKAAGAGELQPQEDGTFLVSYLPYDSVTGLPQEITSFFFDRTAIEAEKAQLEAQIEARNEEIAKIQEAKTKAREHLDSLMFLLDDINAATPANDDTGETMPAVIATP